MKEGLVFLVNSVLKYPAIYDLNKGQRKRYLFQTIRWDTSVFVCP